MKICDDCFKIEIKVTLKNLSVHFNSFIRGTVTQREPKFVGISFANDVEIRELVLPIT